LQIKLVACDLDGTLIDGIPILPEVKEFIVKIRQRGIKFVINSGRSLENILDILSQSKVSCPAGYPEAIISKHGVFIHYLKGQIYVEDEEWNKARQKELKILKQEIGWKSKLWEKIIEEKFKIYPVSKNIDYGVFAVSFKKNEEAEKIKKVLLKDSNFKYTTFLRNRFFLTAALSTTQKGSSLARVAEHFKIPPSQVLAIGDSQNDEHMLNGKYGFIPAAPSNAEDNIKQLVRSQKGFVASLPEGKGVIEIVSSLLNGSKS